MAGGSLTENKIFEQLRKQTFQWTFLDVSLSTHCNFILIFGAFKHGMTCFSSVKEHGKF